MSVISTNINAMFAQNTLTSNSRAQSTSMQQLSTGSRVNSAKDDAAGLAIGQNMTSQIRGLNQAVKNANDGISMLQTADGAMSTQSDMLQRMNELAVQSATGTNSDVQRGYLNTEFQALSTQINKIASDTLWNGKAILDGSKGDNNVQTLAATTLEKAAALAAKTAAAAAHATAAAVTTPTPADDADTAAKLVIKNATATASTNADNAFTAAGTHLDGYTFQTGQTAGNTTTVSIRNMGSSGALALTGASIGTLADAKSALATVGNALEVVNKQRADIGAVTNQLTYAADNMTNISSNVNASRSQIMDTDYAQATTQLAKTQIIAQAATAMLAQANQQPQSVLALLK